MFVKPDKLKQICKNNSLILDEVHGVKYNIFSGDWDLSTDDDINYMAKFNKV